MSDKVEFRPFKLRHAEYLELAGMSGLDPANVTGFSAFYSGPRFKRLFACAGVFTGPEVNDWVPSDFDNASLGFFTHRPSGPVFPLLFCKTAREFLDRVGPELPGPIVTLADNRFRNAERWIEWLGFEPTGKVDRFDRKEFVCHLYSQPQA